MASGVLMVPIHTVSTFLKIEGKGCPDKIHIQQALGFPGEEEEAKLELQVFSTFLWPNNMLSTQARGARVRSNYEALRLDQEMRPCTE